MALFRRTRIPQHCWLVRRAQLSLVTNSVSLCKPSIRQNQRWLVEAACRTVFGECRTSRRERTNIRVYAVEYGPNTMKLLFTRVKGKRCFRQYDHETGNKCRTSIST